MSLINDVLRELADQHRPSHAVSHETQFMLLQAPILHSKYSIWLLGIFLFIVVFVSVLSVRQFFYRDPMSANNNNVSDHVAVDVNEKIPQKVLEQNSHVHKEEISSRQVDAVLQERISDLMQQAERAIIMGRVTSPIEDNAHNYYQKILSIKHDYAPAQEGIKKIAALYIEKYIEQKQLGNIVLADTYLQRAKFIDSNVVAEIKKNEEDEFNNSSKLERNDGVVIDAELNYTSNTLDVNESLHAPIKETIKPFVVAEAASSDSAVEVVTNAGWKDEQLAGRAKELINEGKTEEAMALLKPFVASQSKPVHSATTLAELYLKQNNDKAALVVIEHADYLPIVIKTKINAEIVNMQGDSAAAISLLEKHLTLASDDEKYRALLASLYHKTGNYQQSVLSYQRLISSFGEKPAYWLGLALAFDGLSQHKSALQTYKRLSEFPQLQAEVRTYIDQRIATLQSE